MTRDIEKYARIENTLFLVRMGEEKLYMAGYNNSRNEPVNYSVKYTAKHYTLTKYDGYHAGKVERISKAKLIDFLYNL